MNYRYEPYIVRADQFKEHGKWYQSLELNMKDFYHIGICTEAVMLAFAAQYPNSFQGSWIVVLEPYNINAHPVMWKVE